VNSRPRQIGGTIVVVRLESATEFVLHAPRHSAVTGTIDGSPRSVRPNGAEA
jgi:hypothetical protein